MGSLVVPTADNYFEALGMAFDPFVAGAMPAFFFVGGQRRYLAQRAVHLLYFSGAMVLLLGASGAGKSRLLDEVCTELHELADICRIEANVMMDAAQLRARLANSVGLPADAAHSSVDLVLALVNVRPGVEAPQPVMLLIDSAHVLAIDTLAETVALVQSSGGRLRLLLAGEGELATSWQQASVGTAETLQLPNLDRQETADYLHTRLQAAGTVQPTPLNGTLLDALFAQSGGNIGTIHALAPQLLVPAQHLTISPVQRIRALPALHICALAALLALIIILFLYRGHDATPSAIVERANEAALSTDSRHSVTLALPTAAVRTAPPEAAVIHPAPQPVAASVPLPVPIPVSSAAQQSAPKVLQPKPVSIKPPVTVPDASKSIDQPAQPVAVPGAAGDERRLLAMAPTQFVLQVSGGESRGNIDKFVASADSGQPMLTYRTRLRGKSWFVVVTGPYASRDAALAAIAKLPETLRKQQPWPRSAASVQADIRAYTEKL